MTAPRSLRTRIVLAAVAVLLLTGLLTGWALSRALENDGREAIDQELAQRAQRVLIFRDLDVEGGRRGDRLLRGSGSGTLLAYGGRITQARGDLPERVPPFPDRDGLSTFEVDGTRWRALTLTSGPARLQFLASLTPVEARVASVRHLILLLGLPALGLIALATWAITTVALRPLERLRAGAERVSGTEDLDTALDEEGPEEVRSVAGALNAMLARLRGSARGLQRALEATRRFAADAGHELRTPLTGLRANLEVLDRNPDLPREERQALVRETLGEQERMVRLLAGLQALARGEAADSVPREDVELADLVDAAVFAARRRHPGTAFELLDTRTEPVVRGWDGGLRLLVDNLLDNAALHGRKGGRVRVALAPRGDAVAIVVEDDGPGIPAQEREGLLEPFARGTGTTAPGSGLGLAIVAQQVALHAGRLELGESGLGGLRVEVELPAHRMARSEAAAPESVSG